MANQLHRATTQYRPDKKPLLSPPTPNRTKYRSAPTVLDHKACIVHDIDDTQPRHDGCCGGMLSSSPHTLLNSRTRTECCNIMHKALLLLVSPRTILVQLESWLCIYLVIRFDHDGSLTKTFGTSININVVTFFIAFCLIFAINQSFARRERALQDIATFQANLVQTYYIFCAVITDDKHESLLRIFDNLFKHLVKYVSDRSPLKDKKLCSHRQNKIVQRVYSDVHRLTEITMGNDDTFRLNEIKRRNFTPLTAILCGRINALLTSFEKIKVVKDYRAPLGIRAFSSMMLWILPIIVAPYFVWDTSDDVQPNTSCYLWSWLFFLMFGVLADVKNILDDPFDGDSAYDDILLDKNIVIDNMKQGHAHDLGAAGDTSLELSASSFSRPIQN
eukprot:16697_1